jgi:CopG-like RHH_1 or ribbon-helix-helix domain, RHH_5
MTNSQLKPLMPSKLPRIAVYLPPEIKLGLELGAEKNRRTVSNMAAWIIEQWVMEAKKRGETSESRNEAETL